MAAEVPHAGALTCDRNPAAPAADPDISEFLFPGRGLSALLIHGLTGTPYEMRYLGERLAEAGIRAYGIRVAGHCGAPEELGATAATDWYASAVAGFERLQSYGDPIIVIGLSMGALLATRLALERREEVAALVMLAPAFLLTRKVEAMIRLVRPFARFARSIYVHKDAPSDVASEDARRVHPGIRLMPISAVLNLNALSATLRSRLPAHTRLVALDRSFHVITVDSEKARVADEVIRFAAELPTLNARAALTTG